MHFLGCEEGSDLLGDEDLLEPNKDPDLLDGDSESTYDEMYELVSSSDGTEVGSQEYQDLSGFESGSEGNIGEGVNDLGIRNQRDVEELKFYLDSLERAIHGKDMNRPRNSKSKNNIIISTIQEYESRHSKASESSNAAVEAQSMVRSLEQ